MGKTKKAKESRPKFDRNVEISAPILDPEIIKAIHSAPKDGRRVDIRHGGFKALLSDLNSQDSTDELQPLNDNHVPSYIGISCAVSGYSSYNSYNSSRRPEDSADLSLTATRLSGVGAQNRSRATSPSVPKAPHHVNHIVIDKSHIHSADEERKELTEKLTASATERRRSPSPAVPPTEDDRHHGAYVGARYCPLPPPSKVVNKHIPLLGIDDDQDPDELANEEEHKVEQKIASLYGDNFVDNWRESQTHKSRKELPEENGAQQHQETLKSPKDLVTLRPTPQSPTLEAVQVEVPAPNVKVLAGVEKQFLNKLLTDENPPKPKLVTPAPTPSPQPPKSPTPPQSPVQPVAREEVRDIISTPEPVLAPQQSSITAEEQQDLVEDHPQFPVSPPKSPVSVKNLSLELDEEPASLITTEPTIDSGEKNIEYEIRAESPLANESSPVRMVQQPKSIPESRDEEQLVSFSPDVAQTQEDSPAKSDLLESLEPELGNNNNDATRDLLGDFAVTAQQGQQVQADQLIDMTQTPEPVEAITINEFEQSQGLDSEPQPQQQHELATQQQPLISDPSKTQGGHYYLELLGQEKSFINDQVRHLESVLETREAGLDEDTVGSIRSAIGKANLLINKKCRQFTELCEANISGTGDEFPTLNDDLAGFWDMLSIQVSDVKNSFASLRETLDQSVLE